MTERKKVILFDIDGTVADLSHRLHYVTNGAHDWDNFNKNIPLDTPIEETIFLNSILKSSVHPTVGIIFASGRSEDEREMTEKQLADFKCHYDKLYMRPAGDRRADYIIKKEILQQIRDDGYEPYIVIDDRSSVVEMWRKEGLFVLQCDPNRGECGSDVFQFHDDVKDIALTLLVGPSGAGKTTSIRDAGLDGDAVISSDRLREYLTGDPTDQTQNKRVFQVLHELVEQRLKLGLPVIVDATNIRNKDRIAIAKLIPDRFPVHYMVVDRPLVEKLADRGHRSEELIRRHDQIFKSNLKDILAGDGLPNVKVIDLRKKK